MTFDSILDVLEERSRTQADALAVRFLVDGEQREACWTYGQLGARARAIAAALRARGAAGKRVLLLYPPGLDYVAAFYGCLYAKALAVPAFPPEPSRLHRTLPRLRAIVADASAEVALTTADIFAVKDHFGAALSLGDRPIDWLVTSDLADADEGPAPARPDDVAFLQYTSGSTATPRGVMVTHGNLVHNLEAIRRTIGDDDDPGFVSWLPPYHDMGLIGGILHPVQQGFPVTLLSPLHFLQRPLRWLAAMSRTRATQSVAPNFAYELCVRKTTPEERAALDLTRWGACFNGAEPISPRGLLGFVDAFAPAGFRATTFIPCYGLAEATLLVAGSPLHRGATVRRVRRGSIERGRAELAPLEDEQATPVVSCGAGIPEQVLAIVDPDTLETRADGEVGEVWLSSPSVALGYWNRPDDTHATFGASLAQSSGSSSAEAEPARRFLRTGDLGFVLDGELFVTGRRKDLIIVAGQNHYPQDLERTAEASHPALRPGASAAFSVLIDEQEQIVLVVELDGAAAPPTRDEITGAVRAAVAREHQVSLHAIVLAAKNAVPRTSSGKVQRYLCRDAWLAGTLELAPTS